MFGPLGYQKSTWADYSPYLRKKENEEKRSKKWPLPKPVLFLPPMSLLASFQFYKKTIFLSSGTLLEVRDEEVKPLECWILKYYSLITLSAWSFITILNIYILEFLDCVIDNIAFQSLDNEAYSSKKGSLIT